MYTNRYMTYLLIIFFISCGNKFCGQEPQVYTFDTTLTDELTGVSCVNRSHSNEFIEEKIDEILDVIQAERYFQTLSCNGDIPAALMFFEETHEQYFKYLRYDPNYVDENKFSKSFTILVLAHEIGHLILRHEVGFDFENQWSGAISKEKSRLNELEADKFSGYILAALGMNFEDIEKDLVKVTYNGDDSKKTHPNRLKRFAAVKHGIKSFKLGEKPDDYFENQYRLNVSECMYLGQEYQDQGILSKAVDYFSLAIQLDSTMVDAYLNRGISYNKLGDVELSNNDFISAHGIQKK